MGKSKNVHRGQSDEKPKAHEEQANQKSTASPFFSQSP